MTGGSRIVAIGSGAETAPVPEEQLTAEAEVSSHLETATEAAWWEEPAPLPKRGRLMPLLALLAIAGWTGFFAWANQAALYGVNPQQAIQLLTSWAVPVLLVCSLWLIAMRSSRREAVRFGDAARLLSDESSLLEQRLLVVNRELSLAREFLAAQSRDLDAMGRVATEKLSLHAGRLQELVQSNSAQIDAIATVSVKALDNMEKLRGQLPVIASTAKDAANNIANAGREANSQLTDMVNGFNRLNEFGQASGRHVESLRIQIDAVINQMGSRLEDLRDHSSARFAELEERGGQARALLDNFDAQLAERNRLFSEEMERRADEITDRNSSEVERITALLASLDEGLAHRRNTYDEHVRRLAESSEVIAARIDAAHGKVSAIADIAKQTEVGLGTNLERLNVHLANGRETLASSDKAIAKLTDDSVRLLELLRASSEHSRSELPEALASGEARLAELEQRITQLSESVTRAADRGEDLAASVAATRTAIGQSLGEIGALQGGLEQGAARHGNALSGLKATLHELDSDSRRLAAYSRDELAEALGKLGAATRDAVITLEEWGAQTIAALAVKLGEESAAAIDRVLRIRTAEAVGQLEQAAGHAAGVSHEAASNLRDQLARIDELTGNLERRVAHTRERAEEQIDNDFSRRVALITESLNSNAIDIAKALSSEVTDTAWASYLRGDRGVFTRRAVRLLGNSEARSIAALYGQDSEFRDHVSRYIHDFEAMLRQLLSTRDGHALSVTLLSSDMGKLYVALAQAIERLRS